MEKPPIETYQQTPTAPPSYQVPGPSTSTSIQIVNQPPPAYQKYDTSNFTAGRIVDVGLDGQNNQNNSNLQNHQIDPDSQKSYCYKCSKDFTSCWDFEGKSIFYKICCSLCTIVSMVVIFFLSGLFYLVYQVFCYYSESAGFRGT